MQFRQRPSILRACAPTINVAGCAASLTTLDAVPFVTLCNLANLDATMRGGLLSVIEVHLMCVGGGPTLDFADATTFLAVFQPMIDVALARRLH